jgi:hypothetical protein
MSNIKQAGVSNILPFMNSFPSSLSGLRRRFVSIPFAGLLAAVVLLAGMLPTPLEAQRRDFGRGFGGPRIGLGLGFGLGLGLLGGLAIDHAYAAPVYVYQDAPPVYYYPQPAPQYIYVTTPPPAPPAPVVVAAPAPAAAPAAPAGSYAPVALTPGKSGRIVYDSNGKPVGVIVASADGTQEFVPLAQ